MTQNVDVKVVVELLRRVRVRLTTIAALEGAAAGLGVLALVVLLRWSLPFRVPVFVAIGTVIVAIGVAVRMVMSERQRKHSALALEHAAPSCNNLIVAADELLEHPTKASAPIAEIVFRQAAAAARPLDAAALFPIRRAGMFLGGAVGVLALLLTVRNTRSAAVQTVGAEITSIEISEISISVQSPAYTERSEKRFDNPSRVDAIAGSRLRVEVTSGAQAVEIETLDGKQALAQSGNGKFTGTLTASTDGFIAIEPQNGSTKGTRKLVGLSVTQDRMPRVKVAAPGKDLMFPDGNRSLKLAIEADDDLALASLRLKYTKVSGSGERFTFVEGEVPIQTSRSSAASWKSAASWNLAPLNLEPGDMVVYRAVATDKRPGAPPSESDAYIAEVRAIGSDAAEGFAIDPDEERYALSQQMIISKTERLIAKRATLSAEAFADEAAQIAVEQRRVRAEFVFMMGGELADEPGPESDMTMLDEHEEAEGEADILDGRGANLGRIALVRAVRAMSNASTLLIQTNVADALAREKTALTELERAFSHTRIILRALNVQERLDLTRRMTGPLLETGRLVSPLPEPVESQRTVTLRRALAEVASLSAQSEPSAQISSQASAQASALAEMVLRVDASSKSLQDISATLNDAASAFGKRRADDARRALERAAVSLTAVLRAELVTAPKAPRTLGSERLSGAFNDAMRGVINRQ